MILDSEQVKRLYRRMAPFYDLMVVPLEWLGARRHRARAVRRLELQPGAIVLDLGCGTGLNLPLLHKAVGPRRTDHLRRSFRRHAVPGSTPCTATRHHERRVDPGRSRHIPVAARR